MPWYVPTWLVSGANGFGIIKLILLAMDTRVRLSTIENLSTSCYEEYPGVRATRNPSLLLTAVAYRATEHKDAGLSFRPLRQILSSCGL